MDSIIEFPRYSEIQTSEDFEMQPHHCVPLKGRAGILSLWGCAYCVTLRLKFGISVAVWETSLQ